MFNADWNDTGGGGDYVTKEVNNYISTDGDYVYTVAKKGYSPDFAALHLKEPQIKISNFEGCPHFYGTMFMPRGDTYELQCVITKKYLSNAHEIKGDWNGYKEGDTTGRFLSKQSLMSAFNLFKMIIK